ncbi:hypothetical protein ACF0H5_021051 [Mactra antiquata]
MTEDRRYWETFIWILLMQHTVSGASLGDVCTTDSECSSLGYARCNKQYSCTTGTCVCMSGYGNSNGDGCEKRLRSYQQTCGSGDYCNGVEEECTSGKCQCTYWYEYSNLAGHCKLRTYQLLTQSCGGWWDIECLTSQSTEGAIVCTGSPTTCQCEHGYIGDTTLSYQACRPPRWGEYCTSYPLCGKEFDTTTISDDASNIAPTCTDNTCTCPPSHQHRTVNGYNLCLNRHRANTEAYSLGENCTHFNECNSLLCVKCPGAETGVCMEQDSSSPGLGDKYQWTFVITTLITCVIINTINMR